MIASVGSVLAKSDCNISFMTVTRLGRGQDAIMALGIDSQPSQVCMLATALAASPVVDADFAVLSLGQLHWAALARH